VLDYLQLMADNRARADGHAAAPSARRARVLYASEKIMKKKRRPTEKPGRARHITKKAEVRNADQARKRARLRRRDAKGHFLSKAAARRKTQRLTAKRSRVSSSRRASGTSGISRRSRMARTTTHSSASEASPMAKGKKRASAKQKAAARRNIKKAQAANRRKSSGTKTPRRRARTSRRSSPRKPWEKGLRAARAARRRNKRAHRKHPVRSYSYHRKPKRVRVPAHRSYEAGRRRQTAAQRRASLRNLAKARRARGGRRSSKRRGGGHRHRYAMENPLGGLELFVGSLTGLIGFGGADFVDRLIATHALTPKGTPTAAGIQLYMDTPPTTGSYTGLYNPSAITAPMNLTRWAVGGLMTVVPLGLAHYVKGPVGRSSLQMFGFGAGIRILGKGLLDLLAMLTKNTSTGQRLYDGELRAMALHRGDGSEANLPSAGLGRPALAAKPPGHGTGCACTACANKTPDQLAGRPAGTVGWPSMPREVAPALTPPPPPPPPTTQTGPIPVVTATTNTALTGLPKPRNPYRWGEEAA
jgi:hypothetical protein